MKTISIALLTVLGCSVANADIVNLAEPKPPSICALGVLALAKQIVADPTKIFGAKGSEPIVALTEDERVRVFAFTNLVTEGSAKQETVCSISISVNRDLLAEADRVVLEKIYTPIRLQFKVTIAGNDQLVSPVSMKKIKSIQPE